MDSRSSPGFDRYPQPAHSAGFLLCRQTAWDLLRVSNQPAQKTRDPSGGTAGRVKPYGRWGGWALAPNTASMGRNRRSHRIRSREGLWAFNPPAIFLFCLAGIFVWAGIIVQPACSGPKTPVFFVPIGAVASGSIVEGPVPPQGLFDIRFVSPRSGGECQIHSTRMPGARG
jgi:hypothetical protein